MFVCVNSASYGRNRHTLCLTRRFRGCSASCTSHTSVFCSAWHPLLALLTVGWQHVLSRVLAFQAIDSIHQVGVYCLALVPANTLPKAPLGGIHISETKQRFLEGMLHPCNVLMCPHTCVTNLPKPRQKQPG